MNRAKDSIIGKLREGKKASWNDIIHNFTAGSRNEIIKSARETTNFKCN